MSLKDLYEELSETTGAKTRKQRGQALARLYREPETFQRHISDWLKKTVGVKAKKAGSSFYGREQAQEVMDKLGELLAGWSKEKRGYQTNFSPPEGFTENGSLVVKAGIKRDGVTWTIFVSWVDQR